MSKFLAKVMDISRFISIYDLVLILCSEMHGIYLRFLYLCNSHTVYIL